MHRFRCEASTIPRRWCPVQVHARCMIPRAKDESESQGPSASNYGKAERMLRSERVLSKRWPARHMEREVHIRAPTLALLLPEQQVRPRHWVRREPWEVLLGCTDTLSLNCHNHSYDIVAVPPNLTISRSGNARTHYRYL